MSQAFALLACARRDAGMVDSSVESDRAPRPPASEHDAATLPSTPRTESGDPVDAREEASPEADELRKGCQRGGRGGAYACWELAEFHELSSDSPEHAVHAIALYKRACDLGAANGCESLGKAYQVGQGVPKDVARAAAIYRQGCDRGMYYVCSSLGHLYESGEGVPKDLTRAFALYNRQCFETGDVGECSDLAARYEKGDGVPKDVAHAIKLYRRVCDSPTGGGMASGQGVIMDGCAGMKRLLHARQ